MFDALGQSGAAGQIGLWVGLLTSLALASMLLRDNALARLAQHILVGAGVGYAVVLAVRSVLWPQLVGPLLRAPDASPWRWLLAGLLAVLLLAGTVQIAARVLEVALHKAHELHFPLDNIVDGYGVAPIAPPIPDFIKAMGRTNDAIIYGGRIQLFVRGSDDAARELAEKLPSRSSSAYGQPFAEIFAAVAGDFYKIDPMLFSPARVTVSNLDTGQSFHGGALAPEIVDASFRS